MNVFGDSTAFGLVYKIGSQLATVPEIAPGARPGSGAASYPATTTPAAYAPCSPAGARAGRTGGATSSPSVQRTPRF